MQVAPHTRAAGGAQASCAGCAATSSTHAPPAVTFQEDACGKVALVQREGVGLQYSSIASVKAIIAPGPHVSGMCFC
jgi:hypothetical protein